jgi:hypothetical protein
MKQSIHTAAGEVLGSTQPKNMNGWFDQDCQTALDVRNEARKKMLQTGIRSMLGGSLVTTHYLISIIFILTSLF